MASCSPKYSWTYTTDLTGRNRPPANIPTNEQKKKKLAFIFLQRVTFILFERKISVFLLDILNFLNTFADKA